VRERKLAEAAASAQKLGPQQEDALRRLAGLLAPRLHALETRLESELRRRGFAPSERRALKAITALAALKLLSGGHALADFFEQADYYGRRLAKLEVPPAGILACIELVGKAIAEQLRKCNGHQITELDGARRQLELAAIVTLNNAFYQVREQESQAFYALFQAELHSRSHQELITRCLETVVGWAHASEARLYLKDPSGPIWRLAGAEGVRSECTLPSSILRRLARPRQFGSNGCEQAMVLEPAWRGRFASYWSLPLRRRGCLQAILQLAFSKPYQILPRELRVLSAAAERILEASEKARLAEQLARREQQIRRLAQQMVEIEQMERQRISQDLHDEAGQSLLCLRLQLETLSRQATRDRNGLKVGLREAVRILERTIEEIRRLVRDLSPAVLEHFGLARAVRHLLRQFQKSYGICAQHKIELKQPVPKGLERVVYRLVQECLSNAGRHSRARRLKLVLECDDNLLRLRVEDDGIGFELPQALARRQGLGLVGLQERVALLGGRLEIDSAAGQGTRILIELPVPEASARKCGRRRSGELTAEGSEPQRGQKGGERNG